VSTDAAPSPEGPNSAPEQTRAPGPTSPTRISETTATGLSPVVLAYAVGPIALVVLLVLRRYGLVATSPPVWAYAIAIVGPQVMSVSVERWAHEPLGSVRLHACFAVHAGAVTAAIYLSGWGPALGMAYSFSALTELQRTGSVAWRAVLGWSLLGCVIGQALVFEGWAPSFLSHAHSQALGFLGAFVFCIAIRMAGAVGEQKEQADSLLAERTVEAARARDEAQRTAAHYRAVVENAAEGILTIGADGTITAFNTAAEQIFGWSASAIIGLPATVIVPPDLRSPLETYLSSALLSGGAPVRRRDIESAGMRRDGTRFPMMVAISAITTDTDAPTLSGIVRDLSEQKRVEAQLAHQVLHDPLTGLANRTMLVDRLDQALARVRRSNHMFAVLFVDLDRFKLVNDTLGHSAGDRLLVEAASRIETSVRESDTVARIGGDEFVVLFEEVESVHQTTELADRLIAELRAPFRNGADCSYLSASIGIALYTGGEQTPQTILANADVAMYRAKEDGRNRYALFDEAMQQWITAQNALEADLRQAVRRDELRLFCQPFIAADTGVIRGFEALVRWERPGFGLVTPDDFIPAAEETGLIVEIGAWVLEEACRHAAEWARRWPDRRFGISVNLSTRQLLLGDIIEVVTGALERTGLDPAVLTLELTESTLVDDAVRAESLLRELRALGLHLALDDFGTGYSSLTYLRTFPIDILKIDKSFVSALGVESDDTSIVAGVLALAHNLHMSVVAEGVETLEQHAILRRLGCPYMQGYLFSRPVPIADAAVMAQDDITRILSDPTASVQDREASADPFDRRESFPRPRRSENAGARRK
jgi:diguanylate cyclase (GGDEF)-like protein/PAS domain S-box-containing protein